MQHSSLKQHAIILAKAAVLSFLVGCSSPISEIEQPSDTTPRMVGITTRSTADISYPITLYAFYSESGTLAGKTTASSASGNLTLPLRPSSYHLVALAGAQKLGTTDSPTSNSSIGIPTNGIIESAVQLGAADITVATTDVSVNLTMRYQVAKIDIELHDIPTDVTAVNVSLSSLYSDMTFRGNFSGEQTVNIPLKKVEGEDDTWESNTVYTLKGSSTQLTLSISMTNEAGTKTYGYTHTSNLEAGTPYTFIGSYIEGFYLTGSVTSEGWNEPQNINFTFGVGAGTGEDNGGDDNDDNSNQVTKDDDLPDDTDGNYWVTAIPEAISIWNGHFVGVVTTSNETEATVLLMSLKEWKTTAADATTVWSGYSEGNIRDWRIPTADEMKTIASWGKTANSETLTLANSILQREEGNKLENSQNYLCEEGEKYVLISNDKVNTATSNVIYRLRLVKTITVKIPQE